MPLTTQDLDKGLDFTGVNPANPSDFNNVVDYASPHDDGGGEGRGLVVITVDTADNVPNVPDASLTTKWQRYIWLRKPFSATSPFTIPRLYAWNALIVPDGTYLNWMAVNGDIDTLQLEIDALNSNLATVAAQANNAYSLASSVAGTASTALATANAASTTANDALTTADAANTLATTTAATLVTQQTQIDNVESTANSALTASTAATTTVNNFVAKHNTMVVAQKAAQNVDLGALAAGENNIVLNIKFVDPLALLILTAGKIQFLNAGTYIIDADIQAYLTGDGDSIQAKMIKDSDSSVDAFGTVSSNLRSGSNATTYDATHHSRILTSITVAANEIHRFSLFAFAGNGLLGKASNLSADEVYSIIKIEQIA